MALSILSVISGFSLGKRNLPILFFLGYVGRQHFHARLLVVDERDKYFEYEIGAEGLDHPLYELDFLFGGVARFVFFGEKRHFGQLSAVYGK